MLKITYTLYLLTAEDPFLTILLILGTHKLHNMLSNITWVGGLWRNSLCVWRIVILQRMLILCHLAYVSLTDLPPLTPHFLVLVHSESEWKGIWTRNLECVQQVVICLQITPPDTSLTDRHWKHTLTTSEGKTFFVG